MSRTLPPNDARPVMGSAIVTAYSPPNNTRGGHITAKGPTVRACYVWDDAEGPDSNHTSAALALAAELAQGSGDSVWAGPMVSAHMESGARVHVFIPRHAEDAPRTLPPGDGDPCALCGAAVYAPHPAPVALLPSLSMAEARLLNAVPCADSQGDSAGALRARYGGQPSMPAFLALLESLRALGLVDSRADGLKVPQWWRTEAGDKRAKG